MKIEDAIYHTAHKDLETLAVRMGMSPNTMQHKANPHRADAYFRPRELVSMQAFSGDYAIAHALAGELGGQFVEPAHFAHLSDEALLDLFTGLMGQVGDFSKDFRAAWADGALTAREFGAICEDLYRVKQVCAELQARLATMVQAHPRVVALEKVRPGK